MWNCHDIIENVKTCIPSSADAALLTSAVSRKYLLRFPSTAGVLLVLKKGESSFFVDSRYTEKAEKSFCGIQIIKLESYSQIVEYCELYGVGRIAVEGCEVTLREFSRLEGLFKGITLLASEEFDDSLKYLRAVKSADELEKIAAAQEVTDQAFERICGFIEPGLTERQIAAKLEYDMRLLGSDGPAFDTIVVSGENTSMPHGTPGDRKIQNGDFITMDFGAVFDGYCSDMTRTVAVGIISEEQKTIYHVVLEAQKRALSAICPGAICKEIDAVARDFIAKAGYEGFFGHGLGHSLGVEIHENPSFNTRDDTVLKPGMVLSVEPGIYLPGKFGVRIEDIVSITQNGFKDFTSSPKHLLVL